VSKISNIPVKRKLMENISAKQNRFSFFDKLKSSSKAMSVQERLDFYGFIGTLVSKGKKLQDACSQVADTLDRQIGELRFGGGDLKKAAKLYRDIGYELRQGRRLSAIMDNRAPVGEVLMILSGERGDLETGLKAAEMEAKAARQVRETLTSAILYPCFLFLMVIGSLKFVGTSLLPVVAQIVDPSEWAESQRNFYWLSQNISVWLPIFLAVVAGTGFAIYITNKQLIGKKREMIQWLPPFNVIRHLTASSYLTTVSSLIYAGESLKGALDSIRENSSSNYLNYYVENALSRTRTGAVTRGPGAVIGDRIFIPWVMVKLEVFGDGDLESFTERMIAISDEARANALKSVGGLSKLLNTTMLITAGLTVGFAIVTMYSILGEIQNSAGSF